MQVSKPLRPSQPKHQAVPHYYDYHSMVRDGYRSCLLSRQALLQVSEASYQVQEQKLQVEAHTGTSRYLLNIRDLAKTRLQRRLIRKTHQRRKALAKSTHPIINPFRDSNEQHQVPLVEEQDLHFDLTLPLGTTHCYARIWDSNQRAPALNLPPKRFEVVKSCRDELVCVSHINEDVVFRTGLDGRSVCGNYVLCINDSQMFDH